MCAMAVLCGVANNGFDDLDILYRDASEVGERHVMLTLTRVHCAVEYLTELDQGTRVDEILFNSVLHFTLIDTG